MHRNAQDFIRFRKNYKKISYSAFGDYTSDEPLALHRLSPQREEFDAHAVTVMKKRALKLHVF